MTTGLPSGPVTTTLFRRPTSALLIPGILPPRMLRHPARPCPDSDGITPGWPATWLWPSGPQTTRRDQDRDRKLGGESLRVAEQGADPLGVLGPVLRLLVRRACLRRLAGLAVDPDDVPADVGDVEPQRHLRVLPDVAQLGLARLAVEQDRLVLFTEQEPHWDALRLPGRTDGGQPGHEVAPQPRLHVRAAVGG